MVALRLRDVSGEQYLGQRMKFYFGKVYCCALRIVLQCVFRYTQSLLALSEISPIVQKLRHTHPDDPHQQLPASLNISGAPHRLSCHCPAPSYSSTSAVLSNIKRDQASPSFRRSPPQSSTTPPPSHSPLEISPPPPQISCTSPT